MNPSAQRASTLRRLAVLALGLALAAPAAAGDATADPVAILREVAEAQKAGEFAKAARRARKLEPGELAAAAGLLRVRLLRADDEPDDAAQAASAALALAPAAELRARLFAELAGIRLEQGDLVAAHQATLGAADATRDGEFAAEQMLTLAQAYEGKANATEAIGLYERIWRGQPLAPAAITAYERHAALVHTLAAQPPDTAAIVARAERLRSAFRCDLALPLFETALARPETPGADRPRLERSRADCLFERRRYTEALSAYRGLATLDPKDREVAILIGRSLARSGDRNAAIAALEAETRAQDPAVRAQARSFLAVIVEDQQPARAQKLWQRIERQQEEPALASQARWALAWDDLRRSAYDAALPRLDLLADGPIADIEVQRARYWRAIARGHSKNPLTAEAGALQLRTLAHEVPLSYYGMLAAERSAAQPIERAFLGPRLGEGEPVPLRRARLLVDGGFPEIAGLELKSYLDETRPAREQRIAAAGLLLATGDAHRALQIIQDGFGSSLEQGIDPAWRDVWELAWPRPFHDSVRGATAEFGFESALVYAVMREESAYRPGVSSPAGALGLMQIIPPTAGRIAGELGVGAFEPERLYDPDTNIRFGTYYLRSLVERFQGSRPLAIASYNAGPEAVVRWIDRDGALPPDAFVDSVPYGETRRYLRRVLRSYQVYRLLYVEAALPAAPQPAVAAQRPESGRR